EGARGEALGRGLRGERLTREGVLLLAGLAGLRLLDDDLDEIGDGELAGALLAELALHLLAKSFENGLDLLLAEVGLVGQLGDDLGLGHALGNSHCILLGSARTTHLECSGHNRFAPKTRPLCTRQNPLTRVFRCPHSFFHRRRRPKMVPSARGVTISGRARRSAGQRLDAIEADGAAFSLPAPRPGEPRGATSKLSYEIGQLRRWARRDGLTESAHSRAPSGASRDGSPPPSGRRPSPASGAPCRGFC